MTKKLKLDKRRALYVVLEAIDFAVDTPSGVQTAVARMHVLGISAAPTWRTDEAGALELVGYLQLDGTFTTEACP